MRFRDLKDGEAFLVLPDEEDKDDEAITRGLYLFVKRTGPGLADFQPNAVRVADRVQSHVPEDTWVVRVLL
jgi:hypothetical protein